MTPEAKQLLKDKPELCKEIAFAFINTRWKIDEYQNKAWSKFLKEHIKLDVVEAWVESKKVKPAWEKLRGLI